MPRPHRELEAERKPARRTINEYLKDNPGLSKRTVWRLAEKGKLRLVKFGGAGRAFVEETEDTVEPVVPGEHGKAVRAMLAARKAKASS
jgi:hypothetical protein